VVGGYPTFTTQEVIFEGSTFLGGEENPHKKSLARERRRGKYHPQAFKGLSLHLTFFRKVAYR